MLAPGCPVSSIFQLGLAASPGCPCTHPAAAPATKFRVAPNLLSFGCAGNGSSSRPESRILPRSRLAGFGLPLAQPPLRSPLMQAPGLPQFPCTSGFAGDGVPSRLESRILRRCRLTDLRVAPNFSPSVSPMIRIRVAPHPSSSGPGWWISESPRIAPSGSPGVDSSGCPEASFPPGLCQWQVFESPRIPVVLWPPQWCELTGCPGSSLLWPR
jgi:hypothetical protein